MGWIGQHIWDFVSRFRHDVYLENLTESNGNNRKGHTISIDSDGKLYKHDTINTGQSHEVMTGGTDNISGEADLRFRADKKALILGADNNDTDEWVVTRREASSNGEAGGDYGDLAIKGSYPELMQAGNVSSLENMSGGNLSLYGTTSTGNGLGGPINFYTAYQAYSSPSTMDERKTIATHVLNARITNTGELQSKRFTQILYAGGSWTGGARKYLSFNGASFATNLASSVAGFSEYQNIVMPYNGFVDFIILRGSTPAGSTNVGIHIASTNTEVVSTTPTQSVTVDMAADDTPYKFNFGGTIGAFTAGQVLVVSVDTTSDISDMSATMVIKHDLFNSI